MRDYSYIVRDNFGRFAATGSSAASAASSASSTARTAKAVKNSATVPGGTRTSIPESRLAESNRAGAIGKPAPPNAEEAASMASKQRFRARLRDEDGTVLHESMHPTAKQARMAAQSAAKKSGRDLGSSQQRGMGNDLVKESGELLDGDELSYGNKVGSGRYSIKRVSYGDAPKPPRTSRKPILTQKQIAENNARDLNAGMKALDSSSNLNAQVRDPDGVRVKGVGGSYAKSTTDPRYKTFSAYEPGDEVVVDNPRSPVYNGKKGKVTRNDTGANGGGITVDFGPNINGGKSSTVFSPKEINPASAPIDSARRDMRVPQSEGRAVTQAKSARDARNSATVPGGSRTSIPQIKVSSKYATPAYRSILGKPLKNPPFSAQNSSGETIRKSTRMDRDAVNRGFYSW